MNRFKFIKQTLKKASLLPGYVIENRFDTERNHWVAVSVKVKATVRVCQSQGG